MRLPRRSANRGQATVLTVVFMTVLLGMCCAVLDVGHWYHEKRELQATVDASALAGAQSLPDNPGQAKSDAMAFAVKNGGGVSGPGVTFSTTYLPNDTIKVTGQKNAPGIFSRLFGFGSVTVHASAKARTGVTGQALYAAPIVVNVKHPMLQCTPPPCTGATQIDLENLHSPGSGTAAGAFGLINLHKGAKDGNAGANEVASWMEKGFQDYMKIGKYFQVPSSEFNNTQFKQALTLRLNTEVLFPIYKSLTGSGSTAQYDIVGWVGFVPTKFVASGSSGTVYGSFKRVIWSGIPVSNATTGYGAYSVQLVE
jgi:Flp pilus assembly protein TadG